MSTSIPTSTSHSSPSSSSSRPPTIHLPLVPNQSAGPFVLGSSLHRTLAYLRSSNPSSTSARSGVPPNLLFPSVEVTYDDDEQQVGGEELGVVGGTSSKAAQQQPWKLGQLSSSMTGLAPIRVRPCPGVDLIFSTPQSSGSSSDATSLPAAPPVGPPRLQCIVVALGGSHDSEEGDTDEIDAYHEEQYRRPILVTYKGQRLEEIRGGGGGGASGSGRLTRGFIQQVLGPTYPAKRYKQGDGLHAVSTSATVEKKSASSGSKSTASSAAAGVSTTPLRNKWLIQYPGLAFLFDDAAAQVMGASSAAGDVSKDARPTHLVLHHGDDALHPTELAWPIVSGPVSGSDEAPTSSSSKDSSLPLFNTAFTPTAANVSDTEPVPSGTLILHSARLLPGRGVDLSLLCAPFPAPSTAVPQLATVSLRLGETRQQDVLLALGPAERRWIKEGAGEREGTQAAAAAILPRGSAGGREDGDGEEADEEEEGGSKEPQTSKPAAHSSHASGGGSGRGEFWSYPSLGFDLLFYHSSTNANHRPSRRAPIGDLADDLSDFDDDFDAGAAEGHGGSRGAILGKIVAHSDVPGSALWGRYECVPWYIEEDQEGKQDDALEAVGKQIGVKGTTTTASIKKSSRATASTGEEKSRPSSGSGSGSGSSSSDERRRPLPKVTASSDQTRRVLSAAQRIDRTTPPSQLRTPIFSFLHRNQAHTTSTPLETMHLDRSADEHEFHPSRGTLRLDVRTSIEGFPGAVAEVLLKRRGEGQGQGEGEGEDAPAVVVGWTIVEG